MIIRMFTCQSTTSPVQFPSQVVEINLHLPVSRLDFLQPSDLFGRKNIGDTACRLSEDLNSAGIFQHDRADDGIRDRTPDHDNAMIL